MATEPEAIDVSISMSLHVGDWMRETTHLSAAEVGAHVRLMVAAWARGGRLPAEPARLARLAGVDSSEWGGIWGAIASLWTEEGGEVFHQRTLDEIERAVQAKARAVARGRAGRAAQLGLALTCPVGSIPGASREQAGSKPAQSREQAGPPPPPPLGSLPPGSPDLYQPPDPDARVSSGPPASEPGKPPARAVLATLGSIRAELVGGNALFWQPGPKAVEKAALWLAEMPVAAVPDIEPAMRLACRKVSSGVEGWSGQRMAEPDMLVGALISRWGSLREELHGCAPRVEARAGPPARAKGGIRDDWTPNP